MKKTGKFVMTFLPEGCAPSSFAKYTITRTFEKDGDMGEFIEDMIDKGYVFQDAWVHAEYWRDFKKRHPDFKFWDESYRDK